MAVHADSKAVFDELFSAPNPVFFGSRVIQTFMENSLHEQTILLGCQVLIMPPNLSCCPKLFPSILYSAFTLLIKTKAFKINAKIEDVGLTED